METSPHASHSLEHSCSWRRSPGWFSCACTGFCPRLRIDYHVHDTYIGIGPYVFASDSAAFWAVLLLLLAFLVGLWVGLLAVVVQTAKAIRNRVMREDPDKRVQGD